MGITRRDERGQVLPLTALILAVAALGIVGLTRLGVEVGARARASTAADAAALSGALGGRGDAAEVAAANGATLLRYAGLEGGDVRVTVVVDGREATARARPTAGAGDGPAGGGDRRGLAPAMRAALATADRLLGHPVPVVSGFRTRSVQQRLWESRASSPYPVAPPGSSRHEQGLAIDVPAGLADRLAALGAHTGLCRPYRDDPVHFELCGARFTERAPG